MRICEHNQKLPVDATNLQILAMCDYQERVTDRQTNGQTDDGQSDPYVPLCFAGDTKTWKPDKWLCETLINK